MRILNVSAFFESHSGGIEIVAGQLARALGKRGHESRLAAAALDPIPQDTDFTAIPLTATDPLERLLGLPMPVPRAAARRTLQREIMEADAIVVHDALYSTSVLAQRYATKYRKPWLLIQHIGAIPYANPVLRAALKTANRLVTKPMLERAPQVVFISDTVRRYFDGLNWRSEPKLLFNGVDSALFHPPAEPRETGTHQRKKILFVGRFVEKKGLPVLRELAVQQPEWDFLLVGSGPIDPVGWQLPNIKLLGRKNRPELAEIFRNSDALVLPSVGEGFPLVIQEAMATGIPVYCGTESAIADPNATRYLTGIEIDLGDPQKTAQQFSQEIENGPCGPNLSASAYARATYDWDANAAWIDQRLTAVCDRA